MPRQKQSPVKIINATSLDPTKKYLIIFNKHDMTMENGRILMNRIYDMGIESIGIGLETNDGEVKIIELPNKESENE